MDIDFYNANFLSFKQNAEINELQLNLVKTLKQQLMSEVNDF